MIIILDRTSDTILDEVPSQDILENRHRKSLKDNVETFEFQTYADRDYSPHLVVHGGLVIPDDDGKYIEFVINEVVKTRDSFGALILHVYASASFLELTKAKHIPKHTSASETNVRHVEIALEGTSWAPGVVTYAGIRTIEFNHSNPISYLKRVATEFGLEIQFRVEVAYNRVIGRYVDLIERIGQWRGKEVVFGKDLLGVKRTENSEDVYTALYGYGPEDDNGNQISVFVEDLNALERWSSNGKHLVGYYEPQSEDTEMTAGTLRTLTENELEKRINSVITYEISFVDLEYVENFDHEIVRFGDTIRVIDRKFNPPLFVEARIHTIERDIIDEANKVASLGDFVEYTEDEVTSLWRMIRLRIQIAKEAAMSYTDAAIGGVQQDLSDLSTYIDGAFEDSIVSQAEAKAIEKYLNSLSAEKSDLDTRYTEVYANTSLAGAAKTNLASAKTAYNTAHTNLINSINTAIADGTTSTAEKSDVDTKFASYRSALATLALCMEEAIDSITQAKADAAESQAKTYADGLKTAIDGEITDIKGDLSALDTYVDGTFKDGVVSEAEAKAIEKYLNSLNAEKSDLDTKYTEVYNNASLTGTAKTNLLDAKSAYNTSHSSLIGSINSAIADGKATSTEKSDVDTKFADYRTKLATLAQRFEQAIDSIAQAKANSAESAAKTYADGLKTQLAQDISDVAGDVSDLSTYVDGAFEDSVVSQAEAKAIEKYLNSVNAEKADLDARYNEIYANSNLTGTTKTNLASAKTDYNTAHTNLINSINTAISDGKTTTTEKADVDSKFSSYRTALSTLAQRFDKAIDAIAEAKAAAAQFGAKGYTDGVDTQLRTDLRATAPLPTSITLNTDGITATTSDPTQYARLDYRGLFVNKGAIQVQRADGYNTIIDGYMNFNYNVQPAYPPFLHPEVEYYNNNVYRTNYTGDHRNLGFFSFRHEARYLKIRVATFMSNNTSNYSGGLIVYDEGGQGTLASHLFTNQGSASVPSGGTLLTVDLGVPTGNDRAVYIQFKSASSTVYAYARVLRMWLEG